MGVFGVDIPLFDILIPPTRLERDDEDKECPSPEQEEEDRWNQHQFGLCPGCKVGLDDRADFTFNYKFDLRNGVMMCHDCSDKEYKKVDRCANCENRVGGGQIVASTWDRKTGKFSVQFCRFC